MSIKLSDCPPHLHDAIMRQLEKEGRAFPTTTVKYAVAHYFAGKWNVGPECGNLKLVQRLASKLQLQSAKTAYAAVRGMPTAVVVQLTRTTQAKEQ